VLSSCDVPDFGPGREVLHAQPVNFALDHRSGLNDPRGQIGQQLNTDMHMLTVDAAAIQNLAHCVRRCDLELAGVASSAYVSGISALVEDEQELGAACIDMGGLQVPMTTAERIKTVNGGVHATGMDDRDMIDIGGDTGDWDHDRRQVSRAELIGIMRPRVEEILLMGWRAKFWVSKCALVAPCACTDCPVQPQAPAFPALWVFAFLRRTRRMNGGISRFLRTIKGVRLSGR